MLAEFWAFLKYNKKWWLLPIVIVMLLLSVLSGRLRPTFETPTIRLGFH